MMPQDFPASGFEQSVGLAAVRAVDARTATALARMELEIVPALAALTDRVEALTLELRASAHHDARAPLASARHRRQHHG